MQKYTSIIQKLFELYFRVHFKLATKIFDILLIFTFDFRHAEIPAKTEIELKYSFMFSIVLYFV